uniref:Uncharacterized protein n=1 Tax=Anguilla anguilla TaxID=7936 RepID=A0A0E9WMP9_ANGAN
MSFQSKIQSKYSPEPVFFFNFFFKDRSRKDEWCAFNLHLRTARILKSTLLLPFS